MVGVSYADSYAYWTAEEGAYVKPVEGTATPDTKGHEEL